MTTIKMTNSSVFYSRTTGRLTAMMENLAFQIKIGYRSYVCMKDPDPAELLKFLNEKGILASHEPFIRQSRVNTILGDEHTDDYAEVLPEKLLGYIFYNQCIIANKELYLNEN